MASGTRLALAVVGLAALVAILRMVFVPVGSFREGLERLEWGMPAAGVREILGEPNRICASGSVDHVPLAGPDSAASRAGLRSATAERWVYTARNARHPIPRDPSPTCRAPSIASEVGFDREGRLRWWVREMDQTPVRIDPSIVPPGGSARPDSTSSRIP